MIYDSNLIIYFSNARYAPKMYQVDRSAIEISLITKLEALGYWKITNRDLTLLTNLIRDMRVHPITSAVIDEAIRLRQQRSISLGDAIIAATALLNGLTLATHNTKDFDWIDGLELYDPIAAA